MGALLLMKSAITEFIVHISLAVLCILFHRGFLNCSPTKQEIFLDTEILVMKYWQIVNF